MHSAHIQKFVDAFAKAKTIDELTEIGKSINESNADGVDIDELSREFLIKRFRARRAELVG